MANASSIDKVRAMAYDALFKLSPKADVGWPAFKKIHNWDGKHTILRFGTNSITLETLS